MTRAGAAPARHPDDGQDARHRRDLEARVYGGGDASPAEVAELRVLLGAGADPLLPARAAAVVQPRDPAIEASTSATSPLATGPAATWITAHVVSRPRQWMAAGVIALLVAATVGAVVESSLMRVSDPSARAQTTSEVVGSPAEPSTDGPVSEAEALGAQYVDQPQTSADRLPVHLSGIRAESTRRVLSPFGDASGRLNFGDGVGGAGVWVARGDDGSFCLVMAVGTTRVASSCTPEQEVIATGVRLDLAIAGGSLSATWDLASGLLELSRSADPVTSPSAPAVTPPPAPPLGPTS